MSNYHDLSDGIEFSDDRMSILQIFRNGDIRPLRTLRSPSKLLTFFDANIAKSLNQVINDDSLMLLAEF